MDSTDAGREYERRTGRDSYVDGLPGILAAVTVEVVRLLVKGAAAESRRLRRGRALTDPGKLPDWCRSQLARLRPLIRSRPELADVTTDKLLGSDELDGLLDNLLGVDDVEPQGTAAGVPPEFQEGYIQQVLMRAEEIATTRMGGSSQDVLQSFYYATRLAWHSAGRGEPRPSELMLLAAAAEIEPIQGEIATARKRWEDRIRHWRPKTERWDPQWRERADSMGWPPAENPATSPA